MPLILYRSVERLLSSVRYDPEVYVILMKEYYALGWTKKKNIRIRNVASQSQIWCLGVAETRL